MYIQLIQFKKVVTMERNNSFLLKFVLAPAVFALVVVIAIVTLFCFVSSPTLIQYISGVSAVLAPDNIQNIDYQKTIVLNDLIKRGHLISLDDLWSFQSSFFQTIITFLIAINGLLAGLAVVYIRTTSHEKAEEKAEQVVKNYVKSDLFKRKIDLKVDQLTSVSRSDFESTATNLEAYLIELKEHQVDTDYLKGETAELRRLIRIVSNKISQMDKTEAGGNDLYLKSKD
jgi:hypothetical protein